jgi:hypothetical protein
MQEFIARIFIDHWEKVGVVTLITIVSWVTRMDFRITALEKKPPCPTLDDCSGKMLAAEKINQGRFSSGVREFDSLAIAIRETNKILEVRFSDIDQKYDRIINHLLEIKKNESSRKN